MKPPLPRTLLIVEDDADLRDTLVTTAELKGFEVKSCDTAEQAFALAVTYRPTLIFSDVHLTQGDGRQLLQKLREHDTMHDCQFVLMTGDWVATSQRDSTEYQADAYLPKPAPMEEFCECLEARYKQANL